MKKLIYLFGLVMLISACDSIDTIQSLGKNITVLSPTQIYASGRWKNISRNTRDATEAKINTVDLMCYKNSMVCVENRAGIYRRFYPSSLLMYTEEHKITEWSDTIIKAESHTRAYDTNIRLSIPDNTVEKTCRETSARGALADANLVELYVLE